MMYVENHPNGDGHFHECAECGNTIGESDSMVFADSVALHTLCYENGSI